jgi:hypothetical protein
VNISNVFAEQICKYLRLLFQAVQHNNDLFLKIAAIDVVVRWMLVMKMRKDIARMNAGILAINNFKHLENLCSKLKHRNRCTYFHLT